MKKKNPVLKASIEKGDYALLAMDPHAPTSEKRAKMLDLGLWVELFVIAIITLIGAIVYFILK